MSVEKTKKKRKTSLFTWFVVAAVAYFIFSSNSRRDVSSPSLVATSQTQPKLVDSAPVVAPKSVRGVSSKSVRDEIIQTVQANKLVSRAAFGHDEVGGDSRYTLLWVWMSGATGKDYNAVARHFCSVFKIRRIKGAAVSIKRNGSYDTLGRGICR